jgi:hypothetical protein
VLSKDAVKFAAMKVSCISGDARLLLCNPIRLGQPFLYYCNAKNSGQKVATVI